MTNIFAMIGITTDGGSSGRNVERRVQIIAITHHIVHSPKRAKATR